MTSTLPLSAAHSPAFRAQRQRGVVLFIALLVMVALSLAGIALIRSADTATIVAGNLAFTQSATAAVDRSVEQAIKALFDPWRNPTLANPAIPIKTADLLAQNYYACVQAPGGAGCLPPGTAIPEIPAVLATKAAAAGLVALVPDDAAGNKSFYVIERMCAAAGAAIPSNCNVAFGSGPADAGTQHYQGLGRPGGAFYRVTVRVEGPRNTVAYAQAILQ